MSGWVTILSALLTPTIAIAGIVIAYPQRDMHVYTHEPIQVQMHATLPGKDGGGN